jgi:hypothetical protein
MLTTLKKLGTERMYLNIIKATYSKPAINIMLNREKLKAFYLKSGLTQVCLLLYSNSV